MGKVILTCFAGRRRYLEILYKYIDRLKLDEVHIWDYTRDPEDTVWLRANTKYQIMTPQDKSTWKDYYMYYTTDKYQPDDIIIKCDDDIVFIDVDQFDTFIENRRKDTKSLLAFAGIINNRVCGLNQAEQQIIPFSEQNINLVYFSVQMCKILHDYFVHNCDTVCAKAKMNGGPTLIVPSRKTNMININFIAILGKDLWAYQECWDKDEDKLSLEIPLERRLCNYIDTSFTVSHMAFTGQRTSGYDETSDLANYKILAKNCD
jgi:hypothetical protein